MSIKIYLLLLFTLLIVAIFMYRSEYWKFSKEIYINPSVLEISRPFEGQVDRKYLEEKFGPAYE